MSSESSRETAVGASLAVMAVACWGLMPVAAKGVVAVLDTSTFNFVRFAAAFALLSVYFVAKRPVLLSATPAPRHFVIIAAGGAGLVANHLLFIVSLHYISAGTSQVIVQLGPIALLLLSVAVFQEPLRRRQWLGVALFIAGLGAFFNDRGESLMHPAAGAARGILCMSAAALIWTAYGLAQKALAGVVHPALILLSCYGAGALLLWPEFTSARLGALDAIRIVLLSACVLSSLAAYILFAESLVHWEASRSSALLALIPLVTLGYERLFSHWLPTYVSYRPLNAVSVLGVLMVIAGCLAITVSGARGRRAHAPLPSNSVERSKTTEAKTEAL